ncbi:uncharacterized protein HMPREF1541_03493 [Cyphellophora europaea CBS 101466]|uniref:Peptidase A1 domain-containing protein n=1 Tax=Cyphellophora europaea (strain CBS 101466) TaxID=1220924 RepID=W2RYN4_CYPE1|nr:uncharacterized protein HMPREF1541_03493 [Cyphellophora europaea CBS 101466]ETN41557.1 hypothetical protein HMPREF1541_03493 [Cyphellophora europaea CBS 101466]
MAATRINVFRNPAYKANGPKSLVYTLRKYGMTPAKSIGRFYRDPKKTLYMKDADGSSTEVTAENQQNDAFFLSPVTIGTPGQQMLLDFDSGSSDLWIWSTELSSDTISQGEQNGNVAFDPKKSTTYQPMEGSTWKITYGDQSGASGIVGLDDVKIGDITVEKQAIELATNISAQFLQTAGSGLLGFGFGEINTVQPQPVKTPVENMIAQQDISKDQSLFTCYLGSWKDANDPDKGESFYTFGGIDQDAVKASGQEIHYTKIDKSQGFWQYPSTSAFVNGKEISMPGNTAMADTGTTLWMASDELCEAIYGQIEGAKMDRKQGGYVFPKTIPTKDLPDVTVDIGGKQFTIEKEHLGFADVDETGDMVFGGIQPRGDQLPFDIMGDTFLMCVYAIFDVGNEQFGCVQRADPTPAGGE